MEEKPFSILSALLQKQLVCYQVLSYLEYSHILDLQLLCSKLSAIVRSLPPMFYLTHLNFQIQNLTVKQIQHKFRWYLKKLVATDYQPNSMKIEIFSSEYTDSLIEFIGEFVAVMAKYSSHLQLLFISNHWKKDYESVKLGIEYLLKNYIGSSQLKEVSLIDSCTEDALLELSKFQYLEVLNLSHNNFLEGSQLSQLGTRRLRELKLQECREIDTNQVIKLVELNKETLNVLIVDGQSFSDHECDILSRFLKFIRTLQFSYGNNIEKVVPMLFQPNRYYTLESYTFRQAACLKSQAWLEFFDQHFHKLQTLVIENVNLSSQGLIQIGKHCGTLIEVDISWNHSIQNEGIVEFIEKCTKLEQVRMVGLKEITEQPFTKNTGCLPSLKEINFMQCNTVDQNKMKGFFQVHPKTRVIGYYGNLVHGELQKGDLDYYEDDFEED